MPEFDTESHGCGESTLRCELPRIFWALDMDMPGASAGASAGSVACFFRPKGTGKVNLDVRPMVAVDDAMLYMCLQISIGSFRIGDDHMNGHVKGRLDLPVTRSAVRRRRTSSGVVPRRESGELRLGPGKPIVIIPEWSFDSKPSRF